MKALTLKVMLVLFVVCLAKEMSGVQTFESLVKNAWDKVDEKPMFARLNAVEKGVRDLDVKIKEMEESISEAQSLQAKLKSECEELKRLLHGGSNVADWTEDQDTLNQLDINNTSHLESDVMLNVETLFGIRDGNGPEELKVSGQTTSSSETRMARSVAGNIAFSAFLSQSINHIARGQVIKCDRTILNDGNAYNTATGMFNVPISGVYLLAFSVDSYAETHVTLMVNNARMADIICDATPQRTHMEVMSSNTIMVYLSQSQSVWMEITTVDDAQIIGNENWRYTTFSGVLLY